MPIDQTQMDALALELRTWNAAIRTVLDSASSVAQRAQDMYGGRPAIFLFENVRAAIVKFTDTDPAMVALREAGLEPLLRDIARATPKGPSR